MSFFKNLFKGLADDDSDDDSQKEVTTKKQKEKPFYGTVKPALYFKVNEDVATLKDAIEAEDVDENNITEMIAKRNNAQRQEIKKAFQEETGKDLMTTLDLVLKSDYKNVALALLMTPAQYDAHELRQSMKGIGTKEHVLNEILGTRSNEEIYLLKKAFEETYAEKLEDDIKCDARGHYETALLALCKGIRNEDPDIDDRLAKSEAKALYEAGEQRIGTVSSVFVDILTSRGDAQLREIFKRYEDLSSDGFAEVVKDELTGDIEDCIMTLVKAACNKPAYFAERLHLAMKGLGTETGTLTRVIVSRSEIDLKIILKDYKKMYGNSLEDDILAETKGHYEKILLLLCGN